MSVEGEANAVPAEGQGTIFPFNSWSRRQQFVDVFDTGKAPLTWKATPNASWIRLSQSSGTTASQTRLWVSVDWNQAPSDERSTGIITITGGGATRTVAVPTYRPRVPNDPQFRGPVQNAGAVSVEAEDFTRMSVGSGPNGKGPNWQRVESLGRDSAAMTVLPVTSPSVAPDAESLKNAPCLQYDVQFFTPGTAVASVFCSPTQRTNDEHGVRYAIAINDEKPQIVDLQANEFSLTWRENILRNAAIGKTTHTVVKPGLQTIQIWMVDPNVVLDKVVLSVGEPRPSLLGPPEITGQLSK